MSILIGATLALAVGVTTTLIGFGRERAFYPTVTIVIGTYYVLFAVMGGSSHSLLVESAVLVPFLVAAVAGFKGTPWILVAALAAHGILDVLHPHLVSNPGVPRWWPGFCLGYDVVAAGYLATSLIRAGRRARPRGVNAHASAHEAHRSTAATMPLDVASLHAAMSGPTPPDTAPVSPREVHVRLDARETRWEIAEGHSVSAWGYEGTVPGPAIVARVGDTLVAHLVNHLLVPLPRERDRPGRARPLRGARRPRARRAALRRRSPARPRRREARPRRGDRGPRALRPAQRPRGAEDADQRTEHAGARDRGRPHRALAPSERVQRALRAVLPRRPSVPRDRERRRSARRAGDRDRDAPHARRSRGARGRALPGRGRGDRDRVVALLAVADEVGEAVRVGHPARDPTPAHAGLRRSDARTRDPARAARPRDADANGPPRGEDDVPRTRLVDQRRDPPTARRSPPDRGRTRSTWSRGAA